MLQMTMIKTTTLTTISKYFFHEKFQLPDDLLKTKDGKEKEEKKSWEILNDVANIAVGKRANKIVTRFYVDTS